MNVFLKISPCKINWHQSICAFHAINKRRYQTIAAKFIRYSPYIAAKLAGKSKVTLHMSIKIKPVCPSSVFQKATSACPSGCETSLAMINMNLYNVCTIMVEHIFTDVNACLHTHLGMRLVCLISPIELAPGGKDWSAVGMRGANRHRKTSWVRIATRPRGHQSKRFWVEWDHNMMVDADGWCSHGWCASTTSWLVQDSNHGKSRALTKEREYWSEPPTGTGVPVAEQ